MLDGLRRAVVDAGAGLLGVGDAPGRRRGRGRDHRQGALRAHPRPARRRRRHAGRRPAHPRRDARRRDGDPRLQRAAPSPPAAAGAGGQLAVSPRPRHRPGLGPRGDDPRLAALGRAARDARLRGLLRHRGAAGARRRRPRLHVVLVEAAPASAAGDRRDPRARRAGLARGHRRPGRARRTAWPATPRTPSPEPDPPAEVLEEGAFRAARFGVGAELPDPDGRLRPVDRAARRGARGGPSPRRRAGLRGRARRFCPRSCAAAAAPGASGPCTRSPAWGRCCAS